MGIPNQVSEFNRKHYRVEGDDLDKVRSIRLIIEIDGKVFAQVQAREPGIVAFVSRPDAQGFDIEIVEPGKQRFIDRIVPGESTSPPLEQWQIDAIGLTR